MRAGSRSSWGLIALSQISTLLLTLVSTGLDGVANLGVDVQAAYIDPGLGAMVMQAIAAAFFGAVFYFKNLRRAVGRFFLKLVGKAPEPPAAEEK